MRAEKQFRLGESRLVSISACARLSLTRLLAASANVCDWIERGSTVATHARAHTHTNTVYITQVWRVPDGQHHAGLVQHTSGW
jgi:hypothetical protein